MAPGSSGSSPGSSTRTSPSTCRAARPRTRCMTSSWRGPKPADVEPTPVPQEIMYDTGVPGIVTGTPKLADYGTFAVDDIGIAAGRRRQREHRRRAPRSRWALYYVDELATDLWASLDADHRRGHRSGHGGLHRESGHGARVQAWAISSSSTTRPKTRTMRVPAVVRVRADRRARQRPAMWCPPATSSSSGRIRACRIGLGHLRHAPMRAPAGHPVLQARHEDVHVQRSRRASSGRPDSRRGSRRRSRQRASSRRSSAWPTTSGTGRSRSFR